MNNNRFNSMIKTLSQKARIDGERIAISAPHYEENDFLWRSILVDGQETVRWSTEIQYDLASISPKMHDEYMERVSDLFSDYMNGAKIDRIYPKYDSSSNDEIFKPTERII